MAWSSPAEVAALLRHTLSAENATRQQAEQRLAQLRVDAMNFGDSVVETLKAALVPADEFAHALNTPVPGPATSGTGQPHGFSAPFSNPTAQMAAATLATSVEHLPQTTPSSCLAAALQMPLSELHVIALAAAVLLNNTVGAKDRAVWSDGLCFSDKPAVLAQLIDVAFDISAGASMMASSAASPVGAQIAEGQLWSKKQARARRSARRAVSRVVARLCVWEYPTEEWNQFLAARVEQALGELHLVASQCTFAGDTTPPSGMTMNPYSSKPPANPNSTHTKIKVDTLLFIAELCAAAGGSRESGKNAAQGQSTSAVGALGMMAHTSNSGTAAHNYTSVNQELWLALCQSLLPRLPLAFSSSEQASPEATARSVERLFSTPACLAAAAASQRIAATLVARRPRGGAGLSDALTAEQMGAAVNVALQSAFTFVSAFDVAAIEAAARYIDTQVIAESGGGANGEFPEFPVGTPPGPDQGGFPSSPVAADSCRGLRSPGFSALAGPGDAEGPLDDGDIVTALGELQSSTAPECSASLLRWALKTLQAAPAGSATFDAVWCPLAQQSLSLLHFVTQQEGPWAAAAAFAAGQSKPDASPAFALVSSVAVELLEVVQTAFNVDGSQATARFPAGAIFDVLMKLPASCAKPSSLGALAATLGVDDCSEAEVEWGFDAAIAQRRGDCVAGLSDLSNTASLFDEPLAASVAGEALLQLCLDSEAVLAGCGVGSVSQVASSLAELVLEQSSSHELCLVEFARAFTAAASQLSLTGPNYSPVAIGRLLSGTQGPITMAQGAAGMHGILATLSAVTKQCSVLGLGFVQRLGVHGALDAAAEVLGLLVSMVQMNHTHAQGVVMQTLAASIESRAALAIASCLQLCTECQQTQAWAGAVFQKLSAGFTNSMNGTATPLTRVITSALCVAASRIVSASTEMCDAWLPQLSDGSITACGCVAGMSTQRLPSGGGGSSGGMLPAMSTDSAASVRAGNDVEQDGELSFAAFACGTLVSVVTELHFPHVEFQQRLWSEPDSIVSVVARLVSSAGKHGGDLATLLGSLLSSLIEAAKENAHLPQVQSSDLLNRCLGGVLTAVAADGTGVGSTTFGPLAGALLEVTTKAVQATLELSREPPQPSGAQRAMPAIPAPQLTEFVAACAAGGPHDDSMTRRAASCLGTLSLTLDPVTCTTSLATPSMSLVADSAELGSGPFATASLALGVACLRCRGQGLVRHISGQCSPTVPGIHADFFSAAASANPQAQAAAAVLSTGANGELAGPSEFSGEALRQYVSIVARYVEYKATDLHLLGCLLPLAVATAYFPREAAEALTAPAAGSAVTHQIPSDTATVLSLWATLAPHADRRCQLMTIAAWARIAELSGLRHQASVKLLYAPSVVSGVALGFDDAEAIASVDGSPCPSPTARGALSVPGFGAGLSAPVAPRLPGIPRVPSGPFRSPPRSVRPSSLVFFTNIQLLHRVKGNDPRTGQPRTARSVLREGPGGCFAEAALLSADAMAGPQGQRSRFASFTSNAIFGVIDAETPPPLPPSITAGAAPVDVNGAPLSVEQWAATMAKRFADAIAGSLPRAGELREQVAHSVQMEQRNV